MRRIVVLICLLAALALIISCGSEPPAPGTLIVQSDPDGATITMDGTVTEHVTPYTFSSIEAGTYVISVALDGWTAFPPEKTVTVSYGTTVSSGFTLSQESGSLAVTSSVPGAAIFLNGGDSGEVTPFTFEALIPGTYVVTVDLNNHGSDPASIDAVVENGGSATADFTMIQLLVPRIVLLEGFSNTYCGGCPEMADNVEFLLNQDGYGPDRVVYLKWPAFLSQLDPFYWVTEVTTDARVTWYFGVDAIDLPTISGDGSVLGSTGTPVNANGMMSFVDSQPEFADFSVSIHTDEDLGDVTDLSHNAAITLNAPGGTDLTAYTLHVALVYEEVETENESYEDGITEYHWVMRDHEQPSADIGVLALNTPTVFNVTLDDPLGGELGGHAVYPHNKQIIAWVQHNASKDIIQAGSTMTNAPAPAPINNQSSLSKSTQHHAQPGGLK